MAEDYPDYSPSYLLRHGAVKQKVFKDNVIASSTTQLLSITGKGVTYGGYLYTTSTSPQSNDMPVINIDEVYIEPRPYNFYELFNICIPTANFFYLLKFDNNNYCYVVGISPGVTFEKSILIRYKEVSGFTPYVVCRLNYTLLE